MQLSSEYVAGLFDGEGYVGIYPFGKWETLTLKCGVGNTHKGIIDALKAKYGGFTSHYKQMYGWHILANKAETFLRDIVPYAVIKREQIELALEFQTVKGNYLNWRKGKSDYSGMPQKIVELRKQYQQQLKELKHHPQRLSELTSLNEMMQQSELNGNIKSRAEMTLPA